MSEILQVGEKTITEKDLFPLLNEHQMLMPLAKEILLDQAIANIDCTAEETQTARQNFFSQFQISSDEQLQLWLQKNHLTKDQIEKRIVRGLKLEKFKQETWGNKLESYYLKRKRQLDKVVYSLIRTKDAGVAQALYFRIQAGEQSFAEVAQKFSQGAEAQTGGLIGPVEINVPHPQIAQMLLNSQPGKLLTPTKVGEWIVILRLEKYLAAQLDQAMRQRLLNELFNNWVNEQLQEKVSFKSEVSS
jgi:parvulin-like peptidyl-prolyl isomerase